MDFDGRSESVRLPSGSRTTERRVLHRRRSHSHASGSLASRDRGRLDRAQVQEAATDRPIAVSRLGRTLRVNAVIVTVGYGAADSTKQTHVCAKFM